jgi:hypothetical protein
MNVKTKAERPLQIFFLAEQFLTGAGLVSLTFARNRRISGQIRKHITPIMMVAVNI